MNELHLLSGKPDPTDFDRVPWLELDHAYGSAQDVPAQLQALLSPDPDIRRRVLFSFYGNLFHQGTVYSATVAAIPVFQHLLRYPQFAERPRILELLLSFAVGFAEDQHENVDLGTILGSPRTESENESEDETEVESEEESGDESEGVDEEQRQCYLAVGAGTLLYEQLLLDPDPQVVITAAYTLAFFPGHAYDSCGKLLGIAGDATQHEYVRSAALIAASYLSGGTARETYLRILARLLENADPDDNTPMPFPSATAVYCVLREKHLLQDNPLCSAAEKLAIRCLERGIQVPDCSFYRTTQPGDPQKLTTSEIDEIYMPDARFPWGNLQDRIRRHANYRQPRAPVPPQIHRGPDPAAVHVIPGVFDRENVIAAVRQVHAHKWGFRTQNLKPDEEFRPYTPHVMLAWDEILRLLDSDEIEDRWAIVRVLELCGPFNESAVDQLIERLHRGSNTSLAGFISRQTVTERQCQLLCDRLCQGNLPRSDVSGPQDDYLRIVVQHGTQAQLRVLLERGEFKERAAAAAALSDRGELPPEEYLPILTESLFSTDYALSMRAKMAFSHWETAHQWFLDEYETLRPDHRWAIAEAMSSFRADLTDRREALFARIEAETNPVLAAKLIEVVANASAPQPSTVDRLIALCHTTSAVLVRLAVVKTLGSWAGTKMDRLLNARLLTFTDDHSSRVRLSAIQQLAKFRDSENRHIRILSQMLRDADPENRRHAIWLLSSHNALTSEDLERLTSPDQSDRIAAEALLAAALQTPHIEIDDRLLIGDDRALTHSVHRWASNRKRHNSS